jgi:chorismate-pyruvate lyase
MRDATEHRSTQVEVLDPLADYYAARGKPLPTVTNMTPTLEAFHGQALDLRVYSKSGDASTLRRTVTLLGRNDGTPVEFGAIRIELAPFSEDVRAAICACSDPLGAILRDYDIEHHSKPTAFFSVNSDDVIETALAPNAIPRDTPLYGRHNELSDGQGRRLARVTEILPPL